MSFRGLTNEIRREVLRLYQLAVAKNDRALHRVPKLPDVSRPVVVLQNVQYIRVDTGNALAGIGVELLDEMLDQDRHVVAALPKGR